MTASLIKEPVAKILPCEIPQLIIPDVDRNHILLFFLVPVRKIISVQEIYSDILSEEN